jgi:hypothetical protein
LNAKSPTFAGYALLRKDRPVGNGGGLAILVHDSVAFTSIDTSQFLLHDLSTELLTISADVGGVQLDIFNVYLPPASATANFTPNFDELFNLPNNDALFIGNFNAHHPEWCASLDDTRGKSLVSAMDSTDLCILNSLSPTRLPRAANQAPSSPDVSLVSSHLVPSMTFVCANHIKFGSSANHNKL